MRASGRGVANRAEMCAAPCGARCGRGCEQLCARCAGCGRWRAWRRLAILSAPARTRSRRRPPPDEAHLPAEEAQARPHTWLPCPDEHARRAHRAQAAPRQGPQAAHRLVAGRPSGGRSPKRRRLSRSAEFERVYRQGRSKSNRFLVLYAFPSGRGIVRGAVRRSAARAIRIAPRRRRGGSHAREAASARGVLGGGGAASRAGRIMSWSRARTPASWRSARAWPVFERPSPSWSTRWRRGRGPRRAPSRR